MESLIPVGAHVEGVERANENEEREEGRQEHLSRQHATGSMKQVRMQARAPQGLQHSTSNQVQFWLASAKARESRRPARLAERARWGSRRARGRLQQQRDTARQ